MQRRVIQLPERLAPLGILICKHIQVLRYTLGDALGYMHNYHVIVLPV